MSGQTEFQWLSPGAPDLSSDMDWIPKRCPSLVWCPTGHVRVSDTPMGRFPRGTIKGGLHPLYSFGHSNTLSQTSIKFKTSRRDLSQNHEWLVWYSSKSTSPTISVCSLHLGIHPLDGLCVFRESPRLWWAPKSLHLPLLNGDLIVENRTRSWWSFGKVCGWERPCPFWVPQQRCRKPLWLAKLQEQILCLVFLLFNLEYLVVLA
jgi:hypothetical protein